MKMQGRPNKFMQNSNYYIRPCLLRRASAIAHQHNQNGLEECNFQHT